MSAFRTLPALLDKVSYVDKSMVVVVVKFYLLLVHTYKSKYKDKISNYNKLLQYKTIDQLNLIELIWPKR